MSEDFGQRVKRLREAKGLTRAQLGASNYFVPMPELEVEIIEDQEINCSCISIMTAVSWSADLGVSMDYLCLGREHEPPRESKTTTEAEITEIKSS